MSLDERWMRAALGQARRAAGKTAENPNVGCVLVDAQGRLCAAGHTQASGRPHAEAAALQAVVNPSDLIGGCAYVTLEPCAHIGQTPPCASALIKAGLSRVVYAVEDPDPRVVGRGHEMLAAAGLEVVSGVLADEAEAVMAGFLCRQRLGRPEIWVKIATSADGYVAEKQGVQSWLTGPTARRFVHDLRSRCDGLVSAIGTVLIDDPQLTIRLDGITHKLDRFILDSHGRMAEHPALKIWQSADQGKIYLVCASGQKTQLTHLPASAELMDIEADPSGGLSLLPLVQRLHSLSYNRVLVEAGPKLVRSFFEAGLVDKLFWLTSSHKLGGGVAGFPSLDFAGLDAYSRVHHSVLGEDMLSIWERRD